MTLKERRVMDELLSSEEPCLGAVFCSYTFDPAYFEEQVLRSVLRLSGDPNEDAARYFEEARTALQETPVACLIDASVRIAGRRLPYDLQLVRKRTFHPKVILLVYESGARVAVGSGNITKAGLEQNTEIFFSRRLRYDAPADCVLLREIDSFLEQCSRLADHPGTQLPLVRQTLRNRLPTDMASDAKCDVRLLSTFGGALRDQLGASLHPEATITRVSVLAPFFERDDLTIADDREGIQGALADLLALRPSAGAMLHIAVPWDDAPTSSGSADAAALSSGNDQLWAWRRPAGEDCSHERVEYLVLRSVSAKRVQIDDATGRACRLSREECDAAFSEGRLWRVPRPSVHAPRRVLETIAQEHPVCIWLHPSNALTEGERVTRRPLHAKIVLVTSERSGRVSTLALIGSANGSRAALCRGVEQGGNVEAGIVCRFDGEISLRDVLPSLVKYSLNQVDLIEREPMIYDVDLSAWIEDIAYDAAKRRLEIKWSQSGPGRLGDWTLHYLDRELSCGVGAPSSCTVVDAFELEASSAELTFAAGDGEWQLPIRVVDLAALPSSPLLSQLGLRELLALLGRRIGAERLATLRLQRGNNGSESVLDALFGEGFGATDVFKAWWGAAEDLKHAKTWSAFAHRLMGPTGVFTAWQHLRTVPESWLSADEIWIYGCELLRELRLLELPIGPDTQDKRDLLLKQIEELTRQLREHMPSPDGHLWLEEVRHFYGTGVSDVTA